jgi:hypothetical protein
MSGQVEDKKGNPIEDGDTVFTKIRGGKREGDVSFLVVRNHVERAEYL